MMQKPFIPSHQDVQALYAVALLINTHEFLIREVLQLKLQTLIASVVMVMTSLRITHSTLRALGHNHSSPSSPLPFSHVEINHWTNWKRLKIGRYMETTTRPTTPPTKIIIIGSIIEVRDLTDASTSSCLLYTSDAADEEDSVDLGGR